MSTQDSISKLSKPRMTKQDHVYHLLVDALDKGRWYPGERMPAEQDLVTAFQCSRVTLRAAMDRLCKQRLIYRRQGSGTYVCESPHRISRAVIALVERHSTPVLGNSYFINQHIQLFLQASACNSFMTSVLLIGEQENFFAAAERLKLELNDYDGFIFAFPLCADEIVELERRNIHFVSLTKPVTNESTVSYVDIDNRQGMYIGTCHLLELGYRHPILINGSESMPYNQEKTQGFKEALVRYGVPFDSSMHYTVPIHDEHQAAACLRGILQSPKCLCDSIFVYGDWATFGVIHELQAQHIAIPEKMSVIAYGIPNWISRCTGIRITTVDQPLEKQMSKAVELLLQIIAQKAPPCTVQVIQPSLFIRESSGAFLKKRRDARMGKRIEYQCFVDVDR